MAQARRTQKAPEPDPVAGDWTPAAPPADRTEGLARLRQPFPPNQVSLLPKQLQKDDRERGKCEPGSRFSADGRYCGGYHARSIHLDYVGHAALTDRLLDADPEWTWEPIAWGSDALPLRDRDGGLWIRLTVQGVTRLGYGDAQGKTGPNATKEAIGDALRNAAMRFGAALDLWHRGDLHDAAVEQNGGAEPAPTPQASAQVDDERKRQRDEWWRRVSAITYRGSDDDPASLRGAYQEARRAGVLGWPIGDGEAETFADFMRQQSGRLPDQPPGAAPAAAAAATAEPEAAPFDAPKGWDVPAQDAGGLV